MFQRLANQDRTAAQDCVNAYENFIWALARKFTTSTEEAEAVTLEIFKDIWRYSKQADKHSSPESNLIALIARRRLVRYLRAKGKPKSMADIDATSKVRDSEQPD